MLRVLRPPTSTALSPLRVLCLCPDCDHSPPPPSHRRLLSLRVLHHPALPHHPLSARPFSTSSPVFGITDLLRCFAASQPVVAAQEMVTSLHDVTGLPWWGTILVTTAAARASITFPLGLYQASVLARLETIKPQMDALAQEIGKEVAVATRMYSWDKGTARRTFNQAVRKQRAQLIADYNCHPLKAGLVLWFQLPFWVGLSMALRNLAWALPSGDAAAQVIRLQLSVGGVLWFSNMAAPDPTFALPLMFAVVNLCAIETSSNFNRIAEEARRDCVLHPDRSWAGTGLAMSAYRLCEVGVLSRVQASSGLQRAMTWMIRGVTIVIIPVASLLPSGVVMYWTFSSLCGLLSNLALMSPRVRRAAGIPVTSQERPHPYRHIWETLVARFGKR